MTSTLGPGARSLLSLRLAVRGLGMHEWFGIVRLGAVCALVGQVERRCNCDASSPECACTRLCGICGIASTHPESSPQRFQAG